MIGRFAPQFSGYAQHDSQEFLSFLLDGLHEDLNRVQNKPAVETYEVEKGNDHEIAYECWKRHLLRNQSVIVDLFQAQYKSTLVCPQCSKISITFDPFMYLSLPIPMGNFVMKIQLLKYRKECPIEYAIKISKSASIGVLIDSLSDIASVEGKNIVICEMFNNRIYKIFSNKDLISSISPNDKILAFVLSFISFSLISFINFRLKIKRFELKFKSEERRVIPVVIKVHGSYSSSNVGGFPIPFIPKLTTWHHIYHLCWLSLSSYLKLNNNNNNNDDDDDDEGDEGNGENGEDQFDIDQIERYFKIQIPYGQSMDTVISTKLIDIEVEFSRESSSLLNQSLLRVIFFSIIIIIYYFYQLVIQIIN